MAINKLLMVATVFLLSGVVSASSVNSRIPASNSSCATCETVVGVIQLQLQLGNRSISEMTHVVKSMCFAIGGPIVSAECDFILSNMGEVVSMLQNQSSVQDVCQTLTMCPTDEAAVAITTGDVTCFLSVAVITGVKALLNANVSSTQIVDGFSNVCLKLDPSSLVCQAVKVQLVLVIFYLKLGYTPRKISETLTLCPKPPAPPPPPPSDSCLVAVSLITAVKEQLSEGMSPLEIFNGFDSLCATLDPENLVCSTVKLELTPIILALKLGKTPEQVADQFKLCPAAVAASRSASVEETPECIVNLSLIDGVDFLLKRNFTSAEILTYVDRVCLELDADLSIVCKSFRLELAVIIFYLRSGYTPEQVAEKLTFCPTPAPSPPPSNAVAVAVAADSAECDIAVALISAVDLELKDNHTEAEVVDYVDKVCLSLAQKAALVCKAVKLELEVIIFDLKHGETPQKVAEKLKFCAVPAPPPPSFAVAVAADSAECDIAVALISAVDLELKDNHTEAEVVDYVDKVCLSLAQKAALVCKAVKLELEVIIFDLKHGETPQKVAEKLKFCAVPTPPSPPSPPPSIAVAADSAECEIALALITAVDLQLKENRTEAEIVDYFEKVCLALAQKAALVCKAVKLELEVIIFDLKRGETPQTVAEKLKFCAVPAPPSPPSAPSTTASSLVKLQLNE